MSGHAVIARRLVALALGGMVALAGCSCGSKGGNPPPLQTAAKLAFSVQPTTVQDGATMAPAVTVAIEDASGNAVTGSTATVTLALGKNPAGGTLGGTVSAAAVNGVATFTTLSIDQPGSGYTLEASSGSLTSATSAPFDVVVGPPSALVFTSAAQTVVAGFCSAALQLQSQDALGKPAPVAADTPVALQSTSSGNTFYSDDTCRTPAPAVTLAQGQGGATVYFRDSVVGAPTLTASTTGLTAAQQAETISAPGAGTELTYVDPPATGKVRLVLNAAQSTSTTVALDLVTQVALTGYSVAMNLPLDPTRVKADTTLITAGTALPAGSSPPAVLGLLPASGPLQGILVTGQSQKASGAGAVSGDTSLPAGAVLYTVRLDLAPGAVQGVVFDGTRLGAGFRAALRNKLGLDVASSPDFVLGTLYVR